jgi:hypothetical protein
MPTATIKTVFCVQSATGTDAAVNSALADALARLDEVIPGSEILTGLADALGAMPKVISAIDAARADPDDLYITIDTSGDIDQAIWPSPGETQPVQSTQSFDLDQAFEFENSLNISLWDHDWPSGNDLLGSITIYSGEAGEGDKAKLAKNDIEGSAYYVSYRVD